LSLYLQRVQNKHGIKVQKYMDKLIIANKETREKICKHLGVSDVNVSQALKYKRNSKACIAMRKMALENGAKEYELKKTQS